MSGRPSPRRTGAGTACALSETTHCSDLPDDPVYDPSGQPQQIRIAFRDLPGYVPTALVALTLDAAERFCDRFNRRLGLDRAAWTELAGRSTFAGIDESRAH